MWRPRIGQPRSWSRVLRNRSLLTLLRHTMHWVQLSSTDELLNLYTIYTISVLITHWASGSYVAAGRHSASFVVPFTHHFPPSPSLLPHLGQEVAEAVRALAARDDEFDRVRDSVAERDSRVRVGRIEGHALKCLALLGGALREPVAELGDRGHRRPKVARVVAHARSADLAQAANDILRDALLQFLVVALDLGQHLAGAASCGP